MGQKSTKYRDTEGEPSPSPRKSPKRSRSSRSTSREGTPPGSNLPTTVADSGGGGGPSPKGRVEVREEMQVSSSAKKSESKPDRHSKASHRQSKEQKAMQNGDEPMENGDDFQKENVPEIEKQILIEKMSSSPRTPAKVNGEMANVPLTPLNILNHAPQATSTPAPNGVISTGQFDSDNEHTDEEDEAFTPTDNPFQYNDRSPSSGSLASQSTTSSNKRSQSDSYERGRDVNYGKFYTSSYLEGTKAPYLKRNSLNTKNAQKSPHFHRPVNFSYSAGAPDFLKSKKSGMAQLATGGKVIVKRTRRASSPSDLKNEEAVRMSMFPSGKPPKPNEVTKIEREDWPGPPSPAAILPEIMRKRRKSRGEEEEDDDTPQEDPKITKEIEEISKFKDTSGLGSIIYKELSERKRQPVKALDPWKASRVPSAKYEPRYGTRFQSPMFASPSRFLDRPRRSWDDSDLRGYRTISTSANYPVPKPGYGSYGLTPRAATLPVSGFYGGALYDFHYFDYDDSGIDGSRHRVPYTSTSTMNTDHGSRSHISSIHDGPGMSLLVLQRSTWHTEAEPPIYPYERLKISNFDLPKDTDRNMLEIHLNNDDFDELFKMERDEYYRLAEWKRNDLKRKIDLF